MPPRALRQTPSEFLRLNERAGRPEQISERPARTEREEYRTGPLSEPEAERAMRTQGYSASG